MSEQAHEVREFLKALELENENSRQQEINSFQDEGARDALQKVFWKLCEFGSTGTRFEFHRGQLFISLSLFSYYSVQLCVRFRPFYKFNKSNQIKSKSLSKALDKARVLARPQR